MKMNSKNTKITCKTHGISQFCNLRIEQIHIYTEKDLYLFKHLYNGLF